jgi:hypothetical protein
MRAILISLLLIFGIFKADISQADQFVASIQDYLKKLGYQVGSSDGIIGMRTRSGLSQFYLDNNQNFDGMISANELKDLKKALKRRSLGAKLLRFDWICSVSNRSVINRSGSNRHVLRGNSNFSINAILNNKLTKVIHEDDRSLVLESHQIPNRKNFTFYDRTIIIDKIARRFQRSTSIAKYGNPTKNLKLYSVIERGDCKRQLAFQSRPDSGASFTFSFHSK